MQKKYVRTLQVWVKSDISSKVIYTSKQHSMVKKLGRDNNVSKASTISKCLEPVLSKSHAGTSTYLLAQLKYTAICYSGSVLIIFPRIRFVDFILAIDIFDSD